MLRWYSAKFGIWAAIWSKSRCRSAPLGTVARGEGLRPDFDRDLRIGAHVVEPVGMRRRAALGGDHNQAAVVCRVGEGSTAADPTWHHRPEQEAHREHAANHSSIGAELFDQLSVEGVVVGGLFRSARGVRRSPPCSACRVGGSPKSCFWVVRAWPQPRPVAGPLADSQASGPRSPSAPASLRRQSVWRATPDTRAVRRACRPHQIATRFRECRVGASAILRQGILCTNPRVSRRSTAPRQTARAESTVSASAAMRIPPLGRLAEPE